MYLEHLAWPTMALGWTISIFQQGTAALERLDEVFSAQSNIPHTEASPDDAGLVRGDIEIRNLNFTYHNPYSRAESEASPYQAVLTPQALQAINLKLKPGETIALVGSVGSGKSTLLRLLPRVLAVPEGTIFLDGQDITTISLEQLRANIVFMPQASFLFSTTVSQNIAFGRPDVLETGQDKGQGKDWENTEAFSGVVEAAETASVHLDIQGLPRQYQTLVGERGLMLSGGQRQRVALARAILMDAKVLLLDDPFSNVDAETERNILSALRARKVFSDKTTLIATHRFSLVSLCDRVVLMDEGRVLAVGTPSELLATQPLYQHLHRLQELRSSLGDWGVEPTSETVSESLLGLDGEDLAEFAEPVSEAQP
jgi:ATP-binding cassette subfamily B protein